MATMNAAVVRTFGEPPRYQQFEVPQPTGAGEILVDVLAVGLHPRVRTGAAGAHYTSTGTLPMIPGIDGVGQRPDGGGCTSRPAMTSSARWPTRPSWTCGAPSTCPATSMSRRSPRP